VTGRRVRSLATGERYEAGSHAIEWDGRNLDGAPVGTGVYFFRLETEIGAKNAKMLILR
jgi:flagellar hook assembly protein FlgD